MLQKKSPEEAVCVVRKLGKIVCRSSWTAKIYRSVKHKTKQKNPGNCECRIRIHAWRASCHHFLFKHFQISPTFIPPACYFTAFLPFTSHFYITSPPTLLHSRMSANSWEFTPNNCTSPHLLTIKGNLPLWVSVNRKSTSWFSSGSPVSFQFHLKCVTLCLSRGPWN